MASIAVNSFTHGQDQTIQTCDRGIAFGPLVPRDTNNEGSVEEYFPCPFRPVRSSSTEQVNLEDSDTEGSEVELCNAEQPEKRSWRYLSMLTMCLGGLQAVFSIQFATGTNYLLTLEISPTMISLIWLAPPICGAILQPCFGYWSDNHHSRLGKRKPFIVCGGIGLSVFLFTFAWAREISQVLASIFGSKSCSVYEPSCTLAKSLAALSVIALNVSAQALQCGARALLVDLCPTNLQSQVNAWASRTINVASILCYLGSYMDLPHLMPYLGDTQLKDLSILGSLMLLITLSITCAGASNDASQDEIMEKRTFTLFDIVLHLRRTASESPKQVVRINIVQLFSWFAWYPFMIYISSFIKDSASRMSSEAKLSTTTNHLDTISADRYGALALFSFSSSAFVTSICLPSLISRLSSRLPGSSFKPLHPDWYQRPPISWLTPTGIWVCSQINFTICIFGIVLVRSTTMMLVIIGFMGFSWAVSQWIPFTLMNIAILNMEKNVSRESRSSYGRVGTLLGVHNTFIAAPQILSAISCILVFNLAGGRSGNHGLLGISYIFVGCGISSLVAAIMVLRLAKIQK